MKKQFLTAALFCSLALLSLSSCNNDKKDKDGENNVEATAESGENTEAKTENAPESYKMTASPDTAFLGKEREALIKISDIQVVKLMDADGKSTGSELTVKFTVTNKSTIEKQKYFTVGSSDARLELDNGNSVPTSNDTGNTGPSAESTSEATWTFEMPADTKAKKLNFFLNGTRVGVNLD
ncbi:MAG: hypothetical protein ABIP95_15220 [Pelobium sp.]